MCHCFLRTSHLLPRCVLALGLVLISLTGCQALTAPSASTKSTLTFVQKTLGPATQIQQVSLAGESEPVLTSRHWRDMQPDRSDDDRLVFMSNRHSNSSIDMSKKRDRFKIFLLEQGADKPTAISDTEHNAITPRFSPAADTVAFIHARPEAATLELVGVDGEQVNSVAQAPDILDYAWSPDGKLIAAVLFEPGHSRVELIPMVTGDRARPNLPLKPEGTGSVITSVSWSPEGSALAYIVNSPDRARRLYVYDLAAEQSRLISNPEHHVQQPVRWSADGQSLLYASLVDFDFSYDEIRREQVYQGSMQIFLSDRSGQTRQITQGKGRHGAPVFSPDEQRIGFLYADTLDARELSVRTMNLEGKDMRELHQRVAPESLLQWN